VKTIGRDTGRDGEVGPQRDESHKERVDRELIELLNELRVALPGVQVLFAFLLTVPFAAGFDRLGSSQRAMYFGTFLATTVASLLLIAPTSQHRITFRKGDKELLLRTANRYAIAGTALLAVAIGGAVLLIADVLYGFAVAGEIAGLVACALAVVWFVIPLVRRRRRDEGR
jgi:hypothetical protein